jgi:L-arabinose isomerase
MRRLRIGFLPFYVDYYEGICKEFPREKAAVAAGCARVLERFGEVNWDGALITSAAAASERGRAVTAWEPDCVVIVTTIAVFGGISWAAVSQLKAPVLIWNHQLIESVDDGYAMEDIVRNTGQIGVQALANTMVREGRRFRVVTGCEGSREVEEAMARFFRVMEVVAAIRNARLLSVGGAFELMSDIVIAEKELAERLGPRIVHVTAQELTRRYLEVDEAGVAAHARAVRAEHVLDDLTEEEFNRSMRLSVAFAGLVAEARADGGTFNCHADVCLRNPAIGITGCLCHGEQNAKGRPFTCTGDIPTAIAMLLLKRLTGVSMYTEVQVMDKRRDAIVIANSGEGEEAIRRPGGRSTIIGNTNFRGTCGRGASFAYPLAPGPATLVSFTPAPGGYRLIAAEGEILEDTLPDAGALAGFFRFAHVSLADGYTKWMEAGAVHHAATTLGHWDQDLREICRWLEIEYMKI